MLKLYQILTTLLAPFISLYILRRKMRGKEDIARFSERKGIASHIRPSGKLIWVHAASVGESISVLPLIEKLSSKYTEAHFLITTGTITSAQLIQKRMPPRTFHQYIPIDRIPYIQKFLNHWKPDLALWVESELWPNLVTETAKCCKLLLINGRMSNSSFTKWQKYKNFISKLLGCFTICFAQSKADGERLKALGALNVKHLGNIKYDAPPLSADPEKLKDLEEQIKGRKTWVAASTHSGEELIIANIHKELSIKYPDILTIIVPRHATRKDDILHDIKPSGIEISVRSNGDKITDKTGIYIADTMGELGIFYRCTQIVFIGGSLVEHGGQNPLEPARLSCAILCGPYSFNFAEINSEFVEKNALINVSDKNMLKDEVLELLGNNEKTLHLIASSLALVKEKNHILDTIIVEIAAYM